MRRIIKAVNDSDGDDEDRMEVGKPPEVEDVGLDTGLSCRETLVGYRWEDFGMRREIRSGDAHWSGD